MCVCIWCAIHVCELEKYTGKKVNSNKDDKYWELIKNKTEKLKI